MDFQYNFDEKIKEQYIKKYENITVLSKLLHSRINEENPEWIIEDAIKQTMSISNEVIKNVLEDYHNELMNYLSSK